MNESEQKKIASSIVLKARAECRKEKINPYIAIGAFIDEVIRELSTQNSDQKISEFLINIAGKVKSEFIEKKIDSYLFLNLAINSSISTYLSELFLISFRSFLALVESFLFLSDE